ncbi:glutamine synthetase [Cadophora sp. DSE1049]|nr:glutamine synthetase [Cadophora sp. DSE1049]
MDDFKQENILGLPSEKDDRRWEDFLTTNPGILFIRLIWIDYYGITRVRLTTKSHMSYLQRSRIPLAVSPGALDAPYFPLTGRLPRAGVTRIYPDWTSLRLCLFAPGHAQMMCYLSEAFDGSFLATDPRTLLRKTATRIQALHSRTVLVGFEAEFFLLDPSQTPPAPIQNGTNCWSMAGLRGKHLQMLEQIVNILEGSGIPVQQFHTENGAGFFEIATSPMTPMEAMDALIYTHETIKTIAIEHGFQATVFPKPSDANIFAGMHAHVSITPTHDEDNFLAGLLRSLPAICALGMPNHDSHVRLRELSQTTGEWVSWGTEFRDVPLRKISPGHWEVRCIDGTANMYVVLAAILGAGSKGLEEKASLTWRDCQVSPGSMSPEVRLEHGITSRLPESLKSGLALLGGQTSGLQDILGKRMLEKWISVKETEDVACSQLSETRRRAICLSVY